MAYKFTKTAARVVLNNFYLELQELSRIAQTMPHHASKEVHQFSGIAGAIVATCEETVEAHGVQATAEALEEARNTYRDIYESTYYYPSDNEEIIDLQEQFIQEFSSFLLEAATRIEAEAKRIEAEEEEQRRRDEEERVREEEEAARREEEAENRRRAREQAERAREIEEQYADFVPEPASAGSVFSKIGSFFRGLFRR